MSSLKRAFLERLRRLIRWFFPRSVQFKQQSAEPVFYDSASFQPPPELTVHLLKNYSDAGIEMTYKRSESGSHFDELPFPLDESDNWSLPSNPSSLEPTFNMTVRGVVCS